MNKEPDTDSIIPNLPKSKHTLRKLRKWIIGIFISLSALLAISLIVGCIYETEVKKFVIDKLNRQLNTPIIIDTEDINFSVIRNFPFASVDFKNLKALDAVDDSHKDTLFKANKISFQFDLIDIFRKNYNIKRIEIENVSLNLRIDQTGNDNYHFWKSSKTNSADDFSFALEKIVMHRVRVRYKNYKSSVETDVTINKGDMEGRFSAKKYNLKTTGELTFNQIKTDSIIYLSKKNVRAALAFEVDNQTSSYKINSSKIKIEDLVFELSGEVLQASTTPLLNIAAKGKEMNIKSILSLIPKEYKEKIEEYKSTGDFYFNAFISGTFDEQHIPQVSVDFGMRNATIRQVKENVELREVTLNGHYTNGNQANHLPSELSLLPFSAKINNDFLQGELTITDFENPSVKGKIKADFNLSGLQHFIKLDTVDQISGQVNIDAVFKADKRNPSTGLYKDVTTSGDLKLTGMNLHIKNNVLKFTAINGDFKFNNNDLIVNNFYGNISHTDFELKGFFRNIVGYVLKDKQDIDVEATLHSNYLNLNELLANKQEDETKQSKYKLKFSEHINVNLNSEIERLQFRNFEATDIKGIVKLKDKKLVVDPIILSTMNGSITTSGLVDGSDSSKLIVTCFSDVNRINISQLFYEFENFAQSTITNKNIKGMATFKIRFSAELTPELSMNMNTLYSAIDLSIENGELNNVEAMKSLSRFIDLKELENIRFATLKNQIEIKNQMIHIPKMEVKSSAIDLTTSGTHSFDNKINYRIKLALNDLLAKKAKKAKRENDEFGEIADDGLGRTNLFLLMSGTVEKPVIKYDSRSAVQHVKQDLKSE
ncbi:MAG TPA: AsmA-like C-terminal region-containing protein, partial [Chitinophagales bacterium]|nr:AsmA-like C-terminal region-containing protein [Chitinophagales bacterium]